MTALHCQQLILSGSGGAMENGVSQFGHKASECVCVCFKDNH